MLELKKEKRMQKMFGFDLEIGRKEFDVLNVYFKVKDKKDNLYAYMKYMTLKKLLEE